MRHQGCIKSSSRRTKFSAGCHNRDQRIANLFQGIRYLGACHVPIIPKNGSETIGILDYIWFVFNRLYAVVAFAACGGNGLTFLFVGVVSG